MSALQKEYVYSAGDRGWYWNHMLSLLWAYRAVVRAAVSIAETGGVAAAVAVSRRVLPAPVDAPNHDSGAGGNWQECGGDYG